MTRQPVVSQLTYSSRDVMLSVAYPVCETKRLKLLTLPQTFKSVLNFFFCMVHIWFFSDGRVDCSAVN